MSTHTHTPGPWCIKLWPKFMEVRADSQAVPIVHWQGFDESSVPLRVHEANARLIAAAPELLAVAHQALARLVSVSDFSDPRSEASQLQTRLRAAIRKAEGRNT